MKNSLASLLACVVFCSSFSVYARELTLTEPRFYYEATYDLGLFYGSMASGRFIKRKDAQGLNHFPTQGLYDNVRTWIHGGGNANLESSTKEKITNKISDYTNRSLAVGAFAGVLWVGPTGHRLGKFMTLIHSVEGWFFVNTVSKHLVGRYRPDTHYTPNSNTTNTRMDSFPSGHAGEAFAWATSAVLLMDLNLPWTVGLYTAATASGICRIIADRHFFSDILAGAILGVTIPYLTYRFFEGGESAQHASNFSLDLTPTELLATYRF